LQETINGPKFQDMLKNNINQEVTFPKKMY